MLRAVLISGASWTSHRVIVHEFWVLVQHEYAACGMWRQVFQCVT